MGRVPASAGVLFNLGTATISDSVFLRNQGGQGAIVNTRLHHAHQRHVPRQRPRGLRRLPVTPWLDRCRPVPRGASLFSYPAPSGRPLGIPSRLVLDRATERRDVAGPGGSSQPETTSKQKRPGRHTVDVVRPGRRGALLHMRLAGAAVICKAGVADRGPRTAGVSSVRSTVLAETSRAPICRRGDVRARPGPSSPGLSPGGRSAIPGPTPARVRGRRHRRQGTSRGGVAPRTGS